MQIRWIITMFFGLAASAWAASVVIPQQPTSMERVAAAELASYLEKISGAAVPVITEGEPESTPVWYVGATRRAEMCGAADPPFRAEEYRLKALDDAHFLIAGGEPRGIVYGVWDFLERFGGVLWLTEDCTVLPLVTSFSWPADFDLRRAPAFDVRGIYAYFDTPHESRRSFMAHNRLNFFHGESSLAGAEQFGVTPIFDTALPAHTYHSYTSEWPDGDDACFALAPDGSRPRARSGSGPGQICFTYPETRNRFIRQLRERIERDRKRYPEGRRPVIYDISQNDNATRCECPECLRKAEYYGSYSGVVLEFINAVADSVLEYAPEVRIQTLAYMFSEEPPRNITANDRVIVRLAQLGSEFQNGIRDTLRPLTHPNNALSLTQLRKWSRIASLSIWDYWVMYRKDVTLEVPARAIAENLKIYRDCGVAAAFAECEGPYSNLFYALRVWIGTRFMDDPNRDIEEEINRFFQNYYHEAAVPMRQLYDLTCHSAAQCPASLNSVPLRQRTDLDEDFFSRAEEILCRAEAAVGDNGIILRRIGRERIVADRAWLGRRTVLGDVSGMPDLDTVCSRLEKNWLAWERAPERQAQIRDWIAAQKVMIPLPDEFRDRNVVYDLPWPLLTTHYRSRLEVDPDAAGGRAIVLALGDDGLEYGVYSSSEKKELVSVRLPAAQLPGDERYHWYSAGTVTLTPKCYFRIHSSWEIQRPLDEFYESNGMSNTYEIFASIKVTGPSYVSGSSRADAVLLDRILLVRP